MVREFQQHKFLVCLDSPLYLAVVKFQAAQQLGRSYACLLILVEGMHSLNLIDDEVYAYYKQKYSKPLETSPIVKEPPKCDFCGKNAVGIAVHQSGVTKKVCVKHSIELEKHEKWSVMLDKI